VKVRNVVGGRIHLEDGRTLPANYHQFDHGQRSQHRRLNLWYSQHPLPDTTCTKTGTRRKMPPEAGRHFSL
jgi:hypothetical protein